MTGIQLSLLSQYQLQHDNSKSLMIAVVDACLISGCIHQMETVQLPLPVHCQQQTGTAYSVSEQNAIKEKGYNEHCPDACDFSIVFSSS